MDKFFPYAMQSINQEDIEAVSAALQAPLITRGPKVEEFEAAIATYCGAQYAVAFCNATSALFAACFAVKANKFDRLVTTPNTFVASIGAGTHFGAEPLFVDIDRNTGNIDLELVRHNENYVSSRGRNIYMPVHFSGIPVDIEQLNLMITDPNAVIIEDAAHAIGSCYKDGQKVGSCAWSDMTIFSFHPAKTMTTGEGGIVTTNSEELYRQLKLYRNNGIERDPHYLKGDAAPWYYEVLAITGNFNMTDMQAALGISQLQRLDSFIKKRTSLMKRYRNQLDGIEGVRFFTPEAELKVAYHLCVVQIDFEKFGISRKDLMERLKEKGIGTQVHYIPMYRHPFFANTHKDISSYFPEMESYYAQALTLPLYYDLAEADVDYIASTVKEELQSVKKP